MDIDPSKIPVEPIDLEHGLPGVLRSAKKPKALAMVAEIERLAREAGVNLFRRLRLD